MWEETGLGLEEIENNKVKQNCLSCKKRCATILEDLDLKLKRCPDHWKYESFFIFKFVFPVSNKLTLLNTWRILFFQPITKAICQSCGFRNSWMHHEGETSSPNFYKHHIHTLCKALKAVTTNQCHLETKLTFDDSQEQPLFSLLMWFPFRVHLRTLCSYDSRKHHSHCGLW